eukprot:1145394-Pelagomonas_calceolata.AAC.4
MECQRTCSTEELLQPSLALAPDLVDTETLQHLRSYLCSCFHWPCANCSCIYGPPVPAPNPIGTCAKMSPVPTPGLAGKHKATPLPVPGPAGTTGAAPAPTVFSLPAPDPHTTHKATPLPAPGPADTAQAAPAAWPPPWQRPRVLVQWPPLRAPQQKPLPCAKLLPARKVVHTSKKGCVHDERTAVQTAAHAVLGLEFEGCS